MKMHTFLVIIVSLIIFFTIGVSAQVTSTIARAQIILGPLKLLTTLYNEKNPQRRQEFIACLEKNLQHPMIDTIHVLYDTSKDEAVESAMLSYLKSKKVKISYISGRASFGDFFTLANKEYPYCRIIVSNADIYFNDTLTLLDPYDLSNKFLALTRWDVCNDESLIEVFPLGYSQDVWIFSTPLRPFAIDSIQLGLLGCDTTIAYQAHQSGLMIFNPSRSIQCCHLHRSAIRNYANIGPYEHLGKLEPIPKCTIMEIDAKQKQLFEENLRLTTGRRRPIILPNT